MSYYDKLEETKISSKSLHRGVVGFNKDIVRLIDGSTATREYMVHPGASAVLPVIGGKAVLVQQYRYPVHKTTWEIPAGKMKKGQTPLSCAKAELREETGYAASKIKKLISFHPCCAFSDEILHIFIAEGLKPGKTNPDEDEFLNVKLFPLKTAYNMIKNGLITDSKTIIALSLYRNMHGR
ncbi:MAG: NUDIX hydrolase [Elusimicrobium sp.]|jgi:ADP-ribose pyrophosphatase|nr:NUDIX hydrolase [Elusimicrobium sp.]